MICVCSAPVPIMPLINRPTVKQARSGYPLTASAGDCIEQYIEKNNSNTIQLTSDTIKCIRIASYPASIFLHWLYTNP